MINYIWGGLIIISIFTGAITGRLEAVATAAMNGANDAVTMAISLLGTMCLWTGLMKIASLSGLTDFFTILLRPVTRIIFPHIDKNSEALKAITMNMTANLFGMSNAATPLGLKAMKELYKANPSKSASDEICMFVVINTASLELIPSTVLALRQAACSANSFEIIIPVWLASIISITTGVCVAKLLAKRRQQC